jgi:prevent-host-death family protein
MKQWQLQDAKNRLSEVITKACKGEPQVITRHGQPVAVVVSVEDFDNLRRPSGSLYDFFRSSPLVGEALDLTRDASLPRDGFEP